MDQDLVRAVLRVCVDEACPIQISYPDILLILNERSQAVCGWNGPEHLRHLRWNVCSGAKCFLNNASNDSSICRYRESQDVCHCRCHINIAHRQSVDTVPE